MARILFLAHRIPYPPNKGDKIRSWHFLKHLAAHHDVHLGYYIDDPRDQRHVSFLEDMVASQCHHEIGKAMQKLLALRGFLTGAPLSVAAYPSGRLGPYVRKLIDGGQIDVVFLFSGATFPLVRKIIGDVPVVTDLVDVDSAKWAAYGAKARFPLSYIYRREARLLARFEALAAEQSHSTLLVSGDEAALFREGLAKAVGGTVKDVPNGVDTKLFDPKRFEGVEQRPNRLIFTGAMDYAPNIEAAEWFVRDVWPGIKSAVGTAEFVIAGGPPHPRVQALSNTPGVAVTGYVDDMAAEIAAAQVIVAPLLTARGIQNKVLEGMAMARPVVATPAAKEGIDATEGEHLMVAGDAAQMQSAVLKLLQDPAAGQAMGKAARRQVEDRYGWARAYAKLDDLINDALERSK